MRHFTNTWKLIDLSLQKWRQQLKPNQPIIIEIGAGAGLHAIQYAKKNPHHFIIPIERTKIKAHALLQRVLHHPALTNIYPVYGDAIEWICRHCQPNEINAYYILYPNPYPKAKQANKRFMHMPFMAKLIETLQPGGTITLATNIVSYYEEAKLSFKTVWQLELVSDKVIPPDTQARTHFEKKYLARGESCFNLIFKKQA